MTYALASAYALTGDAAGALGSLRRFAATGYTAELASDADFTALRVSPAYAELERRLLGDSRPLIHGRLAFELPERDLPAEGVAYDPREGVFYVSAVHRWKIARMTPDGRFSDFALLDKAGEGAPRPAGGSCPAAALGCGVRHAADAQVCRRGFRSERPPPLRSRQRPAHGSVPVPMDGRAHLLGDLVVTRGGDVLASDSRAPVIYRFAAGTESLVPWVESPLLSAAQGLALAPGEGVLYVAD